MTSPRDLLTNATPRPWFRVGLEGEYESQAPDADLIVAAVNSFEAFLELEEAARPMANLPFPVSPDERTDWRVHQQRLHAALSALKRLRGQQ